LATSNGTRTSRPDPLVKCAGLTAAQLSEVLNLLAGSDIVELDVTIGSTRLSLRRAATVSVPPNVPEPAVAQQPPSLAIASPLVGIFRPSVSPGEQVALGQSIGAIEALGMPTSVDAPQSGTVEELLVHDGSPVEYGEPLLVLRRAPVSSAS
jgi:biotin carboxyl carrier protein